MKTKNIFFLIIVLVLVITLISFFRNSKNDNQDLDPNPRNMTISGLYVCLPHKDTTGPQTEECAFGIKTDSGDYYAVNFGQSGYAMNDFINGSYIKADGFFVIKEALSTNHWDKYNMKGIFTITKMISVDNRLSGKLNINVVCEEALIYMTFENGEKADQFVAECKEGKHPDVIEKYKERMGLGDGATI